MYKGAVERIDKLDLLHHVYYLLRITCGAQLIENLLFNLEIWHRVLAVWLSLIHPSIHVLKNLHPTIVASKNGLWLARYHLITCDTNIVGR